MSTIYALAILAGNGGGDYMQLGSSTQNLTKEQTKISIWVALLANIIGDTYISSRISWPIGTYIQNIVGSKLK